MNQQLLDDVYRHTQIKNWHFVKHSIESTNDASTAEHVPTKQTVNKLSHSAAYENVPATPSPSSHQEDEEGVVWSHREHVRKQQRQDKRRKNTIYDTAKGGNIIVGLSGVKTIYSYMTQEKKLVPIPLKHFS